MSEVPAPVEEPGNVPQIEYERPIAPFTKITLNENDNQDEEAFCRICHETGGRRGHRKLIQPCLCSGTLGNVHRACIERWLTVTKRDKCTICDFQFKTKLVLKPVKQWIWPPLTNENIMIILTSVLVHITVFTQLSCLLYASLQFYYDVHSAVLGIAVAGLVIGMPWTLFITVAIDFGMVYSDYWQVWKVTNRKVKLIVDDLKFYHDVNSLP